MRNGDVKAAAEVYSEALKIYPCDEGIMSELAMALALGGDPSELKKSAELCERVLAGEPSGYGSKNAIGPADKVRHTTRAALCFIYLKAGEKEKAAAAAKTLPHIRESREMVLAQFGKEPDENEINSYLKFIMIGENNEQDIIQIDFGVNMIAVCTERDLTGRIGTLRDEVNAPMTNYGYKKLPIIRVRDDCDLPPDRVRVRHYADYLLDEDFADAGSAADRVMDVLRMIAGE